MFLALTCPSSGGKIVFTQHLVSSLSVNAPLSPSEKQYSWYYQRFIYPPTDAL